MERFPGGFGKECGMAGKRMLPMGIENFEEMRAMGYYYIDKTRLTLHKFSSKSFIILVLSI